MSCRDGRIKVIGGDNIEGLLISSKQLPYKYLEVGFLYLYRFLTFYNNSENLLSQISTVYVPYKISCLASVNDQALKMSFPCLLLPELNFVVHQDDLECI